MNPADAALQGESKDPETPDQQGETVPEVDEQSVIGAPAAPDATLLRQVAEILAAGYLRLIAGLAEGGPSEGPCPDPSISLDSPAQQSDELDRHQRHRRPRCKQI